MEYLLVVVRQNKFTAREEMLRDILLRLTVAHDNSASIGVLLISWMDPSHAIALSKVGDCVAIGKVLAYLEERLYLSR